MPIEIHDEISLSDWNWSSFQYHGNVYIVSYGRARTVNVDSYGAHLSESYLLDEIKQAAKMWFANDCEMPVAEFLQKTLGL